MHLHSKTHLTKHYPNLSRRPLPILIAQKDDNELTIDAEIKRIYKSTGINAMSRVLNMWIYLLLTNHHMAWSY